MGGGSKGGGPKGEGPKFRAFFSCPAAKFVLFFPLWGLLVEFWWCFEDGDPNVHVWALGLWGEPSQDEAACTDVQVGPPVPSSSGHGRLWPIRLWPTEFGQPFLGDRVWPNRLWPALVF